MKTFLYLLAASTAFTSALIAQSKPATEKKIPENLPAVQWQVYEWVSTKFEYIKPRPQLQKIKADTQPELKHKRPAPVLSLDMLERLNPGLTKALPSLGTLLKDAVVSPKYDEMYHRKAVHLINNGNQLDSHYTDAATVLHLTDKSTQTKVVLFQAAMEVDVDGSNPERFESLNQYDLTDPDFQPRLSYEWLSEKAASNPFDPVLKETTSQLDQLLHDLSSFYQKGGFAYDKNKQLRHGTNGALTLGVDQLNKTLAAVIKANKEVKELRNQLGRNASLMGKEDPFIVIPQWWIESGTTDTHPVKLGDFAAVIFNGEIYPAIVGDLGPDLKCGEASLPLARKLNPKYNSSNGLDDPRATYLIFPGSGDSLRTPSSKAPNKTLYRKIDTAEINRQVNEKLLLLKAKNIKLWEPEAPAKVK